MVLFEVVLVARSVSNDEINGEATCLGVRGAACGRVAVAPVLCRRWQGGQHGAHCRTCSACATGQAHAEGRVPVGAGAGRRFMERRLKFRNLSAVRVKERASPQTAQRGAC